MSDLYSQQKAAWHLDRIEALRGGRVPAPVHVQLILSDLCNQDCLPAGSLIECPDGKRAIEDIRVGDVVIGADGKSVRVSQIGNRLASKLFEIACGDRTIRCTGEHPVLTQHGWKDAKQLSIADSAVVRVRMRPNDELEPSSETLGRVYLRSRKSEDRKPIQRVESRDATSGSGWAGAAVSVWLRRAGKEASAWSGSLLVKLFARSPDAWPTGLAFAGASSAGLRADEEEQPDARSRDGAQGSSNALSRAVAHEDRTTLLGVGEGSKAPDQLPWQRQALGESQEPGLSRDGPEEGHRDHDERHIQRWRGGDTIRGRLWSTFCHALFGKRLEVLSRLLPSGSSPQTSREPSAGTERLRIAGIELGWGLELRKIDSIRLIPGELRVYNFACPPIEAYIADGVVVHNCGFCAYRTSTGLSSEQFGTAETHNPNRKIATAKALEIVEDCAAIGVQAIQFTGGGEPTVHPDHLEVFSAAQASGMKTALVTNGVKLDATHPAVRAMSWVRVSVDAGTAGTYARVRRVNELHWTKAWRSIETLARECQGMIGVGFVVTPENFREIGEAARLAKAHGASNIRVGAVFSTEGRAYYGELIPAIEAEIGEALRHNGEGFEVVNLFGRRIGDLDGASPTEPMCGYQYLTTYIGGDLGIYRCCNTAYTRIGKVADLTNMRFRDLFGGAPRPFDARSCRFCQFRGQNEVLAALLRRPTHAEFV